MTHLVANSLVKRYGKGADRSGTDTLVASTLKGHRGKGGGGLEVEETLVATSITLASDPISARNLAQPSTRRNGDPGVVQMGAMVRRLMPEECEALQGFPRGWTDLGGTPDSPRYAALGDAVTVPVAHWIASRIHAAGHARGCALQDPPAVVEGTEEP